jgi:hypothetical protein
MTKEEFLQIVKNPLTVTSSNVSELKEMTVYYPFFSQAQILYAKSLMLSENVHAERQLKLASIYCTDKHWFYYFIYPEKKPLGENQQHERVSRFSGSYFDILKNAGSNEEEIKVSLKNLAERLKQARQMVQHENEETSTSKNVNTTKKSVKVEFSLPDYYANEVKNEEITEEQAKRYIRDRKYAEAIEILKKLNLINPKKSVYFADQIRFLEKVLANQKK